MSDEPGEFWTVHFQKQGDRPYAQLFLDEEEATVFAVAKRLEGFRVEILDARGGI